MTEVAHVDRYESFLTTKEVTSLSSGIETIPALSPHLFGFQRASVEFGLQRGCAALFQDCGLGKTPQQLEWANVVANHTDRPVLVLAPLAVARQTEREAVKFRHVARYVREPNEAGDVPIVITNYERLDRFDPSLFSGVVLDESSILKAYSGATKQAILRAFASTPYKLACSATPAPNDYLELGNHAEFLGALTSHEMIARWFLPDTSCGGKYRLKGHAVEAFWDWVASWARCASKPSDLGFSDEGYELPPLQEITHTITVDVTEGRGDKLFREPDLSATSVHKEARRTAADRARKAADIVLSEPSESWIVWCWTDYEDEALRDVLPDAVSVRGTQDPEIKERALLGFADGTHRIMITKPKLAGFGLNWQHCARNVFVGPSFSYEAYYQAVRRSWRFGQTRPVQAHMVMAHTESSVLDVMRAKAAEHERMKVEMFAAARRGRERVEKRAYAYQPKHRGSLPGWLQSL